MNMFSNKFEKRSHAVALDFVFYNFAAIGRPLGATPSGRLEAVLKTAAVVGLIRAETAENLTMRTHYRKKVTKFQTQTRPDQP